MSSITAPIPAKRDKPVIVCVDDEEMVLKSLKRSLIKQTHELHCFTDGAEALGFIEKEKANIDLIISDMRMPNMDGATVLKKAAKQWPQIGRIMLTGYTDTNSTISAINQGKVFAYLQKPWTDEGLSQTVRQAWQYKSIGDERAKLVRVTKKQNLQLAELNRTLDEKVKARTSTLRKALHKLEAVNLSLTNQHMSHIKVIMNILEHRTKEGREHSKNVMNHAMALAEGLDLDEKTLECIYNSVAIHDIGLIGLPDQLLASSYNRLQSADVKKYQTHTLMGEQLLRDIPQLESAAKLIRSHHEHWDGGGYPDGLAGNDIPIGAQIIAISSDLDDLRNGHLFGRKFSDVEAQEFLLASAGGRYSRELVRLSIEILSHQEKTSPDEEDLKESSDMEIRNGMLSEDLYSSDGVLLLAKGTRINRRVLQRIKANKQKL